MKTCSKCLIEKDEMLFYKNGKSRRGVCKQCSYFVALNWRNSSTAYKEWHEKNFKTKQKAGDIRRKYGLSIDTYDMMLLQQDNRCAICKCVMTKICVDHNHKTGTVRGLLCNNCNLAIGHIKENLLILDEMRKYLVRSNVGKS